MADKNNEIEKEIREQIHRAKAPPKPEKGGFQRMLLLLLVLAAVLGVVWYASYRDFAGVDSLRRLFAYNKVSQDADGRAEMFRYDSDRSAAYSMLGDDLLIVSTTRIQVLGRDGVERWSKTVSFTNPAIEIGAQIGAVYDVGGKELYLVDARGLRRDMSGESGNGILAVSINDSDYLALTTLKSGYRSAVTVYNDALEPIFTFNSSERYVSDACVLNDNQHLGTVTLGESDGVFASRLSFYAFDREEELSETTLSGSIVLSLGNLGGKLTALQDDRMTVFSADGSLAGSCRYEYPYLRGQSMDGANFAALLLSQYRSGNSTRIMTVGEDGQRLGMLDVRSEALDVSAAGRYVAVLYGDSLTIYTAELTEYATLSGTDFAKQVIMRPDGTALLIGASRAWLYIPS